MKLHEYKEDFKNLISIVSKWKNISEVYIERDYFIVYTLMKLQDSEYNERCFFKGGTSLSKCYPGSIERFSEDIDLTYLSVTAQSDRQIEKDLKKIEQILASDAKLEKIGSERNSRNKSSFIKYNDEDNGKIKLEIGSCVKPDPFQRLSMRTYIHEYLLESSNSKAIIKFELKEISINTLQIERTFLDKVFAIKRHTLCGTIEQKVRHLYDVTMLFGREEIQKFIIDYKQLKKLVQLTKSTDYFYFEKRSDSITYDPMKPYDFNVWKQLMNENIRKRYESLHKDLLFTDVKQDFDEAILVLDKINSIFKEINE